MQMYSEPTASPERRNIVSPENIVTHIIQMVLIHISKLSFWASQQDPWDSV